MWLSSREGGEVWVDEGPDERRAAKLGRSRLRESYARSHPSPPRYRGRAVWEPVVACVRRPLDDGAEEAVDAYLTWLSSRAQLEPGSVPPETPRELTRPFYCGLFRATVAVLRIRQGDRCARCGLQCDAMIPWSECCWHPLDPAGTVLLCPRCHDDSCDEAFRGKRGSPQTTLDSFRKPSENPFLPFLHTVTN